MLKSSFANAEQDVRTRALLEARVEAEQVMDALRAAMAADGETLLSAEEILVLDQGIERLAQQAQSSDVVKIKAATDQLARDSDEFAARRMDATVSKALAGHTVSEFEELK
jgi:molecular chaperone HscA